MLYAFHFSEGIAIAARADWTRTPKNDPGSMPCYTCDGERWGAIDSGGRTVIPFVFDEITTFGDDGESGAYKAHFGGWESGAWGVIDRAGSWLAEPKFRSIGYEYVHGCFTFCSDPGEDAPCGLYSVSEGRAVLPEIYDEIDLFETGDIRTERRVSNSDGSETIERRMLDASGSIKFDVSRYRWITECNGHYEAHLLDGPTIELLDTKGRPLESGDPIVFFYMDRISKEMVYGLQDARGRVLMEPKYDRLRPLGGGLYYAVADKKAGVIDEHGGVVIPMMYESVSISHDGTYICTARGDCAAYRIEARG